VSAISHPITARSRPSILAAASRRGELFALLAAAATLNLWSLQLNGWANTYYSAAVRSMTLSWHNFLFASLDQSGLMGVDKPPLALWVQALSARIFGFHPLALLIPQALMGVVAVALVYDIVRRRFGRPAGFVAGLALATTPVIVAVSRHNNPDELLVLCSVTALWFALRALETGRTKWFVLAGVAVGLGFETKMGVALMVVPGIVLAALWVAPKGTWRTVRQLAAGGGAMAAVGLAWPLLVTLTPAADRPWISGTSDNSIWSLISGYNGLGRLSGQTGGPGGGGGGTMFGGPTGPLRLLQSGLGDQAGWLLGFAVVAGVGLLVATRLRRRDRRTGWLIAIGGAFLTTAVAFSFAGGIFHPYYVSLLAPFTALLLGAGVAQLLDGRRRWLAPLMVAAGIATQLAVLGEIGGRLGWAVPLVIAAGGLGALALVVRTGARTRAAAVAVTVAALFAAPTVWAAQTVGHATSGTFPTGGPASAASLGGPGQGGTGARPFSVGTPPAGSPPAGGAAGFGPSGGAPPPGTTGPGGSGGGFTPGTVGGAGAGGFGPGGTSNTTLTAALAYAKVHGGGTVAVESQSSAASAILTTNANVAGLGGFSGRESSVSVGWLAQAISSGRLRWVVAEQSGGGLPGDTRTGSSAAIAAVTKACKSVSASTTSGSVTLYDCLGRGTAVAAQAQ
jgi:4-amino-4-deoxy-L-arabinose transferase-like glycosyltransferase